MKIINQTKHSVLAERAEVADTPSSRAKGLLGRTGLDQGEALILDPCSSIHTFFMKFSIDVLFLDKQNKVVKIAKNLKPGRLFGTILKGKLCIELPVGIIDKTGTGKGDQIFLE